MTFSDRDYKRAFAQYLPRGTPIEETLKALSPGSMLDTKAEDHPTKYYIWHTQEDDKVRPSHRANDGKVFAWDDPPPTGNPGEAYGCRCWAEPYYGDVAKPLPPVGTYPVAEFTISEFETKEITFIKRSNAIRIETLGFYPVVLGDAPFGLVLEQGSVDYRGFTSTDVSQLMGNVIVDVHREFFGEAPIEVGHQWNTPIFLGPSGTGVTIKFTGTTLTNKATDIKVWEVPN